MDLLQRCGIAAVLTVVVLAGCATGNKRDLPQVHPSGSRGSYGDARAGGAGVTWRKDY